MILFFKLSDFKQFISATISCWILVEQASVKKTDICLVVKRHVSFHLFIMIYYL